LTGKKITCQQVEFFYFTQSGKESIKPQNYLCGLSLKLIAFA
jgi:hypothetical protein